MDLVTKQLRLKPTVGGRKRSRRKKLVDTTLRRSSENTRVVRENRLLQ
jgi:hypothetical protein